MRKVYHPPPFGTNMVFPLLTGIGLAAALFLLLPLTRFLAQPTQEAEIVHNVDTSPPPPPPPREPDESPPQEAASEPRPLPSPQMDRTPPPVDPPQLNLALAPTVGDVRGDFSVGFAVEPGAVAEVDAYELNEVDSIPRALQQLPPRYPHELRRESVSGHVVLEFFVEPDGSVTRINVVDSSHRPFARAAVEAVRHWRFEPGQRDGSPVRTIVRQKFPFDAE